jgi:hypothetical protein
MLRMLEISNFGMWQLTQLLAPVRQAAGACFVPASTSAFLAACAGPVELD